MEQMNQELETTLCCMTSQNPFSWLQQILWVEYPHNTLTSSDSSLSPFQCAYRFQPLLFPALERGVSCLSGQRFIRSCLLTWVPARASILRSVGRYTGNCQLKHENTLRVRSYSCPRRILCSGWSPGRWLPGSVEPHLENHQSHSRKVKSSLLYDSSSYFPCLPN